MTRPNNPYLLKAKIAAKAMEEKLELERQAELAEMSKSSYCNPEPYTEAELRAISNDDSHNMLDADDKLKYRKEWETDCKVEQENQMSVFNKQVKHVVQDVPYYLGDCLVINFTDYQWETWTLKSQVFEILRVEVIVAREIYYLDLIVDADSYKFLGLGQCSDKEFDFTISINICKSLAIQKYMEEAY